ncbi:TPA: hypothetical protein R8T28_001504, partial [Campylobacter jejuni]|nr:hypothetical protein [Campylobacter jejuni]
MIFYKSKRLAFFLTSDIVLILLSVYLAFSLRFSGDIPSIFYHGMMVSAIILLVLKLS